MKMNPLIAAAVMILLFLVLVVMLRSALGAPEIHEKARTELDIEEIEKGALHDEEVVEQPEEAPLPQTTKSDTR